MAAAAVNYTIGMKNGFARRAGSATRLLLLLGLLAAAGLSAPAAAQSTGPTAEPVTEVTTEPDTTPAAELTSEPAGTPATTTPTVEPTPPPAPIDPRFGVIESFEDPAAAGRLGVAWTRARFQWAEMQPDGPDEWQPSLDDEVLAVELDAGREVVGLLIGIPDWARDRGGLPRGLALPASDPDNLWAVFVGRVVAQYAGRIDHWIIWNEPDIADRDAPGHTWDGNIEQFVQLQRTAYLAAKAANPDAVVHLAAFTYFWDPGYFNRFLDLLVADPDAAAHDHYFDVATAHLYFQPNAVYNVLYAFGRVLAGHGLDKPIWLVETNAPPMNDPYWEVPNWTLVVGLNEQAAFVPQALAAALAAGAERVAVYKLKDTEDDRAANPEPFGLLRWDDSRRPAFDAYRVAIRRMAGTEATVRERWDTVGQFRLTQAGQTTTVLFARLPGSQMASVPATADTAEWVDMWGKTETITPDEDGFFTVTLPGALCLQTIADYCMIGGTTYYLIQDSDRPAATRPTPRATLTAAATTTPRPTRPATTDPTATTASTATPSPTPISGPSSTPSRATPAAAAPGTAAPLEPTVAPPAGESPAGWTGYTGLIVIGLGLLLAAGLLGRNVLARPPAARRGPRTP